MAGRPLRQARQIQGATETRRSFDTSAEAELFVETLRAYGFPAMQQGRRAVAYAPRPEIEWADAVVAKYGDRAAAAGMGRDVGRDRLTTAERNRLPARAFALPERRALPVHDDAHIRNAAARLEQMRTKWRSVTPEEYRRAKRAILAREAERGIGPFNPRYASRHGVRVGRFLIAPRGERMAADPGRKPRDHHLAEAERLQQRAEMRRREGFLVEANRLEQQARKHRRRARGSRKSRSRRDELPPASERFVFPSSTGADVFEYRLRAEGYRPRRVSSVLVQARAPEETTRRALEWARTYARDAARRRR